MEKRIGTIRLDAWFPLKDGEYLDYDGCGKFGIYGVERKHLNALRTFIKAKPFVSDVKIERNVVLANTYIIRFKWNYIKNL